jgi:hypothetical protein
MSQYVIKETVMKLTNVEKSELLGLLNTTIVVYAQQVGVAQRFESNQAWSAYSLRACELCGIHGVDHNKFPKLFPSVRIGGLRDGETLELLDYKEIKKLADVGVYIVQQL